MRKFEAYNISKYSPRSERNLINEIPFQRFRIRNSSTSRPDSASDLHLYQQSKAIEIKSPFQDFNMQTIKLKDLFRKSKNRKGNTLNQSIENLANFEGIQNRLHQSLNPTNMETVSQLAGVVCSFPSIHELGSVKAKSIGSSLNSEVLKSRSATVRFEDPVRPTFFTLNDFGDLHREEEFLKYSHNENYGAFGRDTIEFGTPEILSQVSFAANDEDDDEEESIYKSVKIKSCYTKKERNLKLSIEDLPSVKLIPENIKKNEESKKSTFQNFKNYFVGFLLGFILSLFGVLLTQPSLCSYRIRGALHGSLISGILVYPILFCAFYFKHGKFISEDLGITKKNLYLVLDLV